MKKLLLSLFILSGLLTGFACSTRSGSGLKLNPAQDAFFDVTRHIMSPEEIQIYKHLPDATSRQEFAKDFWAKRDPDPTNSENEALAEFLGRIDYANRMFKERKGKDRGWDTLRGRLFLQLGPPDERNWGTTPLTGQQNETRYSQYETWVYYQYQMRLVFVDKKGFGEFEFYGQIPSALGTALEQSKLTILGSISTKNKNNFKFTSEFEQDQIVISIPSKLATFNEVGDHLNAGFTFTISTYLNYVSGDTIEKRFEFSKNRDELLNLKDITFTIPVLVHEKGLYFFDIIGKNEQTGQRYRNFCKIRK